MSEWREVCLRELIEIKHGYAFKGANITNDDNGVVLVTPGNFAFGGGFKHSGKKFFNGEIPNEYILKKADIIVTMTDLSKNADTLGYSALIPNDGKTYLHNQRIGLINIKSDLVDKNYIYWLLRTPWYQRTIANSSTGVNVKHTSPEKIYAYKVNLPNRKLQTKIADVLSTYDKLIENNNRRIQILEQTAEELYKEWFVRMRFPGYEKTKFDKGIPEGWEVKKIGDLFNVSSSKRVYSSDYVESGIPFYRSKEVIKLSNGESISDLLYISENKYMEFKRKFGVPNRNDILITSVGTIGIPLLITNDNPFYFKDGNLTWIQSSSNPFLSYYLYCWLKSDIGYQSLSMFTIGTSQSALTITNLKRLKLLLPDETLLYKFNNLFKNLNTKINNLNQQNQTLTKQRDLLLPRLMNGTITVK